MSFFKIVLFPPLIATLIAFPAIFALEEIGYFCSMGAFGAGLTGMGLACFGLIIGYIIIWRY